jgi:hypothetical protein
MVVLLGLVSEVPEATGLVSDRAEMPDEARAAWSKLLMLVIEASWFAAIVTGDSSTNSHFRKR